MKNTGFNGFIFPVLSPIILHGILRVYMQKKNLNIILKSIINTH